MSAFQGETHQLDLESERSGHVLNIVFRPAEPEAQRWAFAFGSHAWSIFSDDDMRQLVEFIGYPKPVEDRTAALQNKLEATRADLSIYMGHAQALDAELELLRSHLRTLLTSLDGAWWLKAAHAYHELAARVDLEREQL